MFSKKYYVVPMYNTAVLPLGYTLRLKMGKIQRNSVMLMRYLLTLQKKSNFSY